MAGGPGRLVLEILAGPLFFLRRNPFKGVWLLLAVTVLTIATQVGGAILWLSLPLLERLYATVRPRGRVLAVASSIAGFALIYAAICQTIMPGVAASLGRRQLQCFPSETRPYGASSILYCLANRNYAVPSVHRLLAALARELQRTHPGSAVSYLDAGFPFMDGFPLLPHLSHRDGRKIDLSFFYREARTGLPRPRAGAWPLGYWAYTPPRRDEPRPCAGDGPRLSLRWDFDWLQPMFDATEFDGERTGAMVKWLVANAGDHRIEKILLEPHLEARLGLNSPLVRFQGCRAARHDDHLHLQAR